VNAALNGRILIIEGIEKAERNLLPILNNLLENRELNLDDGHFLVAPDRYDKLVSLAKDSNGHNDLKNLSLLRVHEDFRVIAIGLPVPKYKGNLLDPPLRSRFQAHLVNLPAYDDFKKYLTSVNVRVDQELIKNLCDFGYSFYANEMASLNLADFPVENLDKIIRIMNSCYSNEKKNSNYNENYLNTNKLIAKLYPHNLLLKDEETNKKMYFDLMQKFNLKSSRPNHGSNEIDFKLIGVKNNSEYKQLLFQSSSNNNKAILSIDLVGGASSKHQNEKDDAFIMNDYHSSQLVDMMLNHSSGHDFCLIGGQGKNLKYDEGQK
jgi:von Willebrand factor A domain-containing protein 8